MDLLEAIRKEVLRQKEEEALNFFSSVADFREFIETANPEPDVSVTVKMTSWTSERVKGDHGTRVTFIGANQRAFFDSTVEALAELTMVKRKPYIAQITVWDAKLDKASRSFSGKTYMLFRPGALYELRQVDGVGFYADIAKGNVQFERGNTEKIVEVAAPIVTKRKAPRSAGKKKAKERTEEPTALNLSSDTGDEDDEDVTMERENEGPGENVGIRTRSNASGSL